VSGTSEVYLKYMEPSLFLALRGWLWLVGGTETEIQKQGRKNIEERKKNIRIERKEKDQTKERQ
jgi:hypothetical protein